MPVNKLLKVYVAIYYVAMVMFTLWKRFIF